MKIRQSLFPALAALLLLGSAMPTQADNQADDNVFKEIGEGVKEAATKTGHAFRDAAKEVGKVGKKVAEGATEVGHASRDAVKETGEALSDDE